METIEINGVIYNKINGQINENDTFILNNKCPNKDIRNKIRVCGLIKIVDNVRSYCWFQYVTQEQGFWYPAFIPEWMCTKVEPAT
jgi:hypothetical protein